jgi:hypothetical protein
MKCCISCGEVTGVSRRNLCFRCAMERVKNSWEQLREKKGPVYERWATATGRKGDPAQTTLSAWWFPTDEPK